MDLKLYHRVPNRTIKDCLMPLSHLEKEDAEFYELYNRKYKNRLILKKRVVPSLDCLWNDVIHMTAVHPKKIVAALNEAGFDSAENNRWFEICPDKLLFSERNTAIYLYQNQYMNLDNENTTEFVPFSIDRLKGMNELPSRVVEYYRQSKKKNERPLTFHMIPHVLHKGRIEFSKLEEIEV